MDEWIDTEFDSDKKKIAEQLIKVANQIDELPNTLEMALGGTDYCVFTGIKWKALALADSIRDLARDVRGEY